MFKFKKFRSNEKYTIYHIKNEKNSHIKLFINDTYTPFGIEKFYNKKIVKWDITNNISLIETITKFEQQLQKFLLSTHSDKYDLYSKIIDRNIYGKILETNVEDDSFDLIKHEKGEVLTFTDIKPDMKVNVELEFKSFNVSNDDNKVYYNITTKQIYIL